MGFFTCNPVFSERLERCAETSTQQASGFSQSLITQLLADEWGLTKYVTWLRGLQSEYKLRRDALLDLFMDKFYMSKNRISGVWGELDGYTAYGVRTGRSLPFLMNEKKEREPLLSLVPPEAGMFVWFKVHVENLPGLKLSKDEPEFDTLEKVFWDKLARGGLLIGPGFMFAADKEDSRIKTEAHYRMSFSGVDHAKMSTAVTIIADLLKELS